MRISDWSSDVCSSDLRRGTMMQSNLALAAGAAGLISYWLEPDPLWLVGAALIVANWPFTFAAIMPITRRLTATAIDSSGAGERRAIERWGRLHAVRTGLGLASRSEEHTSELQSLMRISYAVFCLKKKKEMKKTVDIIRG